MTVAILLATTSGDALALSFEAQEARLARELAEGVSAQRIVAAGELATLSRSVAWPLIRVALADPELEVRARAAHAAGRLGISEALPITRGWLEDEDADLRMVAVRLEGVLGDAASVPLLARALGDARFSVRSAAAEALGRLGLPECAAPLGTALEDSDATVRVVVAEALGRTPGPEATRLLLSRSLDAVLEVRVQVVEALARRREVDGDAVASDGRITAVLVGALADEASEVRIAAILGIAMARHAAAAPLLARMVDDVPEGVSSAGGRAAEASREARAAVAALGRIDDPIARAGLVRALASDTMRSAATDALRSQLVRAPEATELALTDGLSGPPATRGRVAEVILELAPLRGGDPMTRALLATLGDGSAPAAAVLPALGAAALAGGELTEDAIVVLLEHLDEPANASAALDGLERLAERGVLDVRAVDPLLILTEGVPVADPRGELVPRVLALLGRLDDARALPRLLRAASGPAGEARRAALEALAGSSRLDASSRAALVPLLAPLLASPDPRERLAIVEVARRHGDEVALTSVLDALEQTGELDRALAIELIVALLGGAAEPAAAENVTDPALRERAERVIVEALASTDPRLSSSAAAAMLAAPSALAARVLAPAVARTAWSPRSGDRVALPRALRAHGAPTPPGLFLDAEAEPSLTGAEAVSPERLLAPELRFPASVVRSFSVLSAVRRGLIGRDASAALCDLAARREPSVRANAGLALAFLGVGCASIDPVAWISDSYSVSVQLAGVRWAAALAGQQGAEGAAIDPRRLRRALADCVDRATDVSLRTSCMDLEAGSLAPPVLERDARVDVQVLAASGGPDAGRLVSLRFVDGATVVLRTDGAGRVALRMDRAASRAGAPSGIVIEDPYATVLER